MRHDPFVSRARPSFPAVYLAAIVGLAAWPTGCSDEDTPPLSSGRCADFPLRQEAIEPILADMRQGMLAAGESEVVPASAYAGDPLYPTSVFDYAHVRDRQETLFVINSETELSANPSMQNFIGILDDIQVDWSSETLIIALQWLGQFTYLYGRANDHLTIYAGHLLPCEEYPEEELNLWFGADVMFWRVPKVASASFDVIMAYYRFVNVAEAWQCIRSPRGPILDRTGGLPSVLSEAGGYHMWYSGYSATTGGVFDTLSSDGITWEPSEWDQSHYSQFDSHSPYPGHYSPEVAATTNGYVMYYGDGYDDDLRRSESTDGVLWHNEVALLAKGEPGQWDDGFVGAPAVLSHEGSYWMWYTAGRESGTTASIGLATSSDGLLWFRHAENPVFTAGPVGTFDDLSVDSPMVIHDGQRFLMWYTAATGGGDYTQAQTTSIGLATSADGVHWQRSSQPVLVPTRDFESLGLMSPTALLEGDGYSLWYTGINDNGEPSIGRAVCVLP